MNSESEDRGAILERFREYLSLLARLQLDTRLQGKVDLSGVVQQTLLETHQARDQFQELDDGQKTAWLRRSLVNNLTDEVRKLSTAARNVSRERSLEIALEESAARLEACTASEQSSPVLKAMHNEELMRLAAALAQLPEDQRQAVELHHLQGC